MFEPTRKNIQPSDATLVITQTRGVTGSKQNHHLPAFPALRRICSPA